MARGPDTPCAGGCGKLLWMTSTSSEHPMCMSCRRERRKKTCEQCGEEFQARGRDTANKPNRFCSAACRIASRTMPPGVARARRKAGIRARKLRHAETWDGVTDQQIYERDGWICQIPGCELGPIDPELKYPSPLSAEPDHIVPVSLGGADTAPNKRASHKICNERRCNRMHPDDVPVVTVELAPLGLLPARARRPRRPRCPVHSPRKPAALPWPRRLYCRPCRFCDVVVTGFLPPRSKAGILPEFTVCQVCQADAKCSSCGRSMYITPFSSPPAERVCQPCQRDRPAGADVESEPVSPARAPLTLGQFWAWQNRGR